MTEGPNLRHFALIAAIYFASPWGTVAFPLLMGAALIEKGFQLSDSLLYVGVSMFGPAAGTILGSLFVDRLERRLALALFGIGMIASAVAFAASLNPIWLMAADIAFQLLAILQVSTMTTYAAEVFPTAWRARTSTATMFSVIVAALSIGVGLVFVAPKGRAGRAVD